MKTRIALSAAVLAALAVALPLTHAQEYPAAPVAAKPAVPAGAAKAPTAQSVIERGRYLVSLGGCNDCHTPKKMGPQGPEADTSRLLSGHPESEKVVTPAAVPAGWLAATNMHLSAWSGPWGVSFAANLTPDENTGLGIWTEATFVKSMRTGKHNGVSRPILPPMPWQSIGQLTDADLKAMYAYLRSIPPVKNRVPEPLAPAGGPPASR